MNTMKKRVAQVLAGVVGLASVATAGVAMAANGDRSGASSGTGARPSVVSTDSGRSSEGRGQMEQGDDHGRGEQGQHQGQHAEPGDDHGMHQEPGDDQGHHDQGDDHGGNSGPGGDSSSRHGDNSGWGSGS